MSGNPDVRSRRSKRDIHGLNADGFVARNPRDREAAHRAQHLGIATSDPKEPTCPACRSELYRARREKNR